MTTAPKKRKRSNPNGRRKAPVVTLPDMPTAMPTTWDKGADGPANRARLVEEPATDVDVETGKETPNPNNVRRHRRESWAATYYRQRKLSDAQFAAAEKLRLAAEGMRERDPLMRIGEIRHGGGDPASARIDARQEYRRLIAAMPLSSRQVIERVVVDDQPIWHGNTAQRERHMTRLRNGLDAIC